MKKQILFLIIAILIPAASLQAAISSVTLTPASPTTLSNGNSYYLAGKQYSFRVQAVDTAATGKAYWNQITLTFPGGQTCTVSIDTDSVVGTPTGITVDTISDNTSPSPYTNIDYQITVRFLWTATEYAVASNTVQTTVTCDLPDSRTTSSTFLHGLCSTISVVNFTQDGVAADGYVNQYHTAFNVTGTVVYNVTGATSADTVLSKDVGEIAAAANIELYRSGTATPISSNTGNTGSFTFIIPAASIAAQAGAYTWSVQVTMNTGGAVETASNTLSLFCDNIQITSITFSGGGGITSAPTYYRSVNIPGTQVTIIATKAFNGGNMIGATTITVSDGLNTFPVVIADAANTGTGSVTTPIVAQTPTDGQTYQISYQITAISGSVFDSEQNIAARVTQPANPVILWDRNDPPGNNDAPATGQTPFTAEASFAVSPSSTYVDFTWQAVSALADPPYDGDFYTYRIYYKESTASAWTIVDRSTPGYTTTGTYNLSDPTRTTARITGLTPLTQYDYFITAVDAFGQEVEHPIPNTLNNSDALYVGAPTAAGYGQFSTNPTSVEASVTDGITNYTFSQFAASITALTRPLRKSSLQVKIYIVSSGDQPDSVNIVLAQDNGSGAGLPAGDLYPLLSAPAYERISCLKTAPNTWTAYIPSANQFLTEGSYCRFIIESVRSGTSTFSDIDSTTDADPNDFEYTFMVQTPTTFTPWPTRVLNNVITDKHPIAYPSYYLSDDAYVTITVHDIKGRPVATLIDNGFRKGGQNIKEGGWSGDNKARRKLGVGLYYIRFEAKRASDGKLILNETEKVVIAK